MRGTSKPIRCRNLIAKRGSIFLTAVLVAILFCAQASAENRRFSVMPGAGGATVSSYSSFFKSGTPPLVIACDRNFMPYTMQNSKGEPAGIFIEIWRLWAQKTGYAITFQFSDWNSAINQVKTGAADIHSGLFTNKKRSEFMDFSSAFYESTNSVFFPLKGAAISSIKELDGEPVGVIQGSDASNHLRLNHPHISLIEFDDPKTMMEAALNRHIRAIADETQGFLWTLGHLGRAGDFKRIGQPLSKKKMVAAVAKGRQDLLAAVEKGLAAISVQELDEIESRWIYLSEARYFKSKIPEIRLSEPEQKWLQAQQSIRIGVNANYPPFEFTDNDQRYAGIISDYVRLLDKRLNLEIQPVMGNAPLEPVVSELQPRVDLFTHLPATPELQQRTTFSHSYLQFPIVVITQSQTQYISGLEELNGKHTAVVRGYSSHTYLQRRHPYIKVSVFDTPYDGLYAVTSGKMFAFVGDLASATYLISKHGLLNLKVAASTPYHYDLAFAVRKDLPELAGIINKGLASVTLKEKNAISRKWLSIRHEDEVDRALFRRTILQISGIAGGIIVIILFWTTRIRKRENRFRSLAEKKVDITQAFSKTGTIVYQSPSHLALLGYQGKELIGRSIYELLHKDDHETWQRSLSRLQNGENAVSIIHRLRHKNGDYLSFESNCIDMTRVKDLRAIVINARDVTDRLKAEQELQKNHAELEKRVRERTQELTMINDRLNREIQKHEATRQRILSYQDSLRSLTSELALAEERERRKIAVDLHDHVSQKLALCRIKLGLLEKYTADLKGRKILFEATDLCRRSLTDTRNLTFEISPPSLYELGLEAALDELIELTQKNHHIRAEFHDDEQPKPMAKDMKITLYRITSELIINTIKHAKANKLSVAIARQANRVNLTVADDGIGFDSSLLTSHQTRAQKKTFGHLSIRERLGMLGGKMDVISQPSNGTTIVLTAPLLTEP